MWFDGAGEFMEMFRGSFPLCLLFFVPICILISPIKPVNGSHEFSVFRMQQFDIQGTPFGCRNTLVNVEARSVNALTLTRRCVVARIDELTIERFHDMAAQNAGGVLILLPEDLNALSDKHAEHLMELERDLLSDDTPIPVYFATETAEVSAIYEDVQKVTNADSADTALQTLLNTATANGFQMIINGPQAKSLNDFQVINIQGKLPGHGIEEQLPTVAIVAHYDTFGVAPGLSIGSDSNGSGVSILLELARLFSNLYANSRTHAKFNLLFLLSGAGKFNYQGTKRWIEDQLDTGESSLLSEVSFVLCLDSLGSTDSLNFHISKPPKENTLLYHFHENLKHVATQLFPDVQIGLVHKKINLGDDMLAWEHERFSIRRLSAVTLSHFSNHKNLKRKSILDTRSNVEINTLVRNTKIIAEALARSLFNLSSDSTSEIFMDGMTIEPKVLKSWIDYLSSTPRSLQALEKENAVVKALDRGMSEYLKDVKLLPFKVDKRDPEFLLYDGIQFNMNAHNVKPAVFDLFLAICIAAYLGVMYLFIQHFSVIHFKCKSLLFGVEKSSISNGVSKTNGFKKHI